MNNKHYKSIVEAYMNFNNQEINPVLSLMSEDILWPNGWVGGYVKGHAQLKDYWTRQWKSINPYVEPLTIRERAINNYEVVVHQIIKDLTGKILSDEIVKHIYQFENGLIKSMEIEKT